MQYIIRKFEWKEKVTITAARAELGLDDHGGDELRGLTCLFEQPTDLAIGTHVPIFLEFFSDLGA